jgi:hypothetical protein
MDNTCKNCKFWREQSGFAGRGTGKMKCDHVDCQTEPSKTFEIDATADDDHNLNADLITGPDFGCVLFQGK